MKTRSLHRAPIVAERLRRIDGQSFAFVPHRFLRHGFFASLRPDQQRLYFFLALAANKDGVSFYSYDAICSALELPLEAYLQARNALIDKDLLAFDGSRFQLLSLPERPVFEPSAALRSSDQLAEHDPATVRTQILHSLAQSGWRSDVDEQG